MFSTHSRSDSIPHTVVWQMAGTGSHLVGALLAAFLSVPPPALRGARQEWKLAPVTLLGRENVNK